MQGDFALQYGHTAECGGCVLKHGDKTRAPLSNAGRISLHTWHHTHNLYCKAVHTHQRRGSVSNLIC